MERRCAGAVDATGLAGEAAASARLGGGGFADRYRHLNQPIHLVAVEFSKDRRRVVSFEVVQAAS